MEILLRGSLLVESCPYAETRDFKSEIELLLEIKEEPSSAL